MLFRGMSCKFQGTASEVEEEIDKLWKEVSCLYEADKLQGLFYNRTDRRVEFVLGLTEGTIDSEVVRKLVPEAVEKNILLPEKGWITGKPEETQASEETQVVSGATYLIRQYDREGNRQERYTCEYPELVQVGPDDLEYVMGMYRQAMERPFCVWSDEYPTKALIEEDIAAGDLYGIRSPEGEIIAAIAKDRDDEVDSLECWSSTLKPAGELARLVIAAEYEGQGLARILIRQMKAALKSRGFQGMHYLVEVNNVPAVKSYAALGFCKAGEADMFGHHYHCYETEI